MDESEKEAIRRATDIVELISNYTGLKKTGNRWKGLCPFHNERTPSFTVDPERGRWHCFGSCGTGGDVFTFLEKAENLSFIEAAERLANKAGITLSRKGSTPAEREASQRAQSEKDRIYNANALAARFYQQALRRAPMAQQYAHEKRKLTHQTMEAFGVGYAPDDWEQLSRYLIQQGVHPVDAEKAGLITPRRSDDGSYYDKFRARLIFPIWDVQERIVAFGGRILVPAENAPKYLNSPETPVFSKSRTLYALNRARKSISERDQAVLVEGYMDVVACHQGGFTNVVATLGTSLTAEHVSLLGRYTKNIVLSFDADDAGVRAALRAAELFAAAGEGVFTLKVLNLPRGEDPDSLVTSGNTGAFRRAIDDALSVPEFQLIALARQYDVANPAERERFLKEALTVISEVRSAMEQDRLIQKIAHYHPSWERGSVHVEESLRSELKRMRFGASANGDVQSNGQRPPFRAENGYGGGFNGGRGNYNPQYNQQGGGGNYPRHPNGRFAQNGFRRGYGNAGYGAPIEPPPIIAPDATADAKAERTVLRALLTQEWTERVRGRVRASLFMDARASALVAATLPMLQSGTSLNTAITRATANDPELTAYADILLLRDEEEPLNPQAVDDCLLYLLERQGKKQARNLSAQLEEGRTMEKVYKENESGEGKNAPTEEELLRQWQRTMQALKQKRNGDAEGGNS